MRKPVDASDIPEDVRATLGIGTPDTREPTTPERSQAGRKRKQTGDSFEHELDFTHTAYEFRKLGRIRRNYIPTRVEGHDSKGARRRAIGAADVDRSGWVKLVEDYRGNLPVPRIVPVSFDAKVLSENVREGWYHHDVKLQHQLHGLKAAADAGECAFLLVLVREVGRVFGVAIGPHMHALLSGAGVQLYYRLADEVRPCVPSIEKSGDEFGWSWISMLPELAP